MERDRELLAAEIAVPALPSTSSTTLSATADAPPTGGGGGSGGGGSSSAVAVVPSGGAGEGQGEGEGEEPVVLAQESVELGAEGGGSGAVDAAAKRASAKANRHLEATATYKAISEVSVAVQYA